MGNIKLGLNLEFARYENGSFDWAMDQAAEIGYKYVEPMVHWVVNCSVQQDISTAVPCSTIR